MRTDLDGAARRVLAVVRAWPSACPSSRALRRAAGLTRSEYAAAWRTLTAAGLVAYRPRRGGWELTTGRGATCPG